MKAIIYKGPNNVVCEQTSKPSVNENEVLIKVSHAGICGSDLNIYLGVHPRAKAPLVLGHEFSGYVVNGDEQLPTGTKVCVRPLISCGQCSACQSGNSHVCKTLKLYGIDTAGGMAEYVKVDKSKIHILPDDFPMNLGAFVEPLAVGIHAVSRTPFKVGDSVVVFGAGTIGLCVASVLKLAGAKQVIVIETNDFRINLAKELGFIVINPKQEDVLTAVLKLTNHIGADIVYDCAAHPSVALQLTDLVKVQGTIEIVGSYKKPTEFKLLDIEFKELTIIGTRVYEARDFETAIKFIQQDFPYKKLLTILTPEEAKQGFANALTGENVIKTLFKFAD